MKKDKRGVNKEIRMTHCKFMEYYRHRGVRRNQDERRVTDVGTIGALKIQNSYLSIRTIKPLVWFLAMSQKFLGDQGTF